MKPRHVIISLFAVTACAATMACSGCRSQTPTSPGTDAGDVGVTSDVGVDTGFDSGFDTSTEALESEVPTDARSSDGTSVAPVTIFDGGASPTTWGDAAVSPGFLDPANWTSVPNGTECGLQVGGPGAVPTPRAWTSCGTGCRAKPASIPPYLPIGAEVVASTGDATATGVVARLLLDRSGERFVEVVRLDDDTTIAAVRSETGCLSRAPSSNSPFGFSWFGATSELPMVVPSDGSAVRWAPAWYASSSQEQNGFALGLTYVATYSDASVRAFDMVSDTPALLETAPAPAYVTAVQADVGVWAAETVGRGTIHGVRDGVVKTLLNDPTVAMVVAVYVTGSTLYWLAAPSGDVANGHYDDLWVMSSPIPAVWGGPLTPTKGTTLGPAVGTSELRVSGDYLATRVSATAFAAAQIVVVQLSTGKTWRIPPRSGAAWAAIIGLTGTEVWTLETTDLVSSGGRSYAQRVTALSLSALDALASSSP